MWCERREEGRAAAAAAAAAGPRPAPPVLTRREASETPSDRICAQTYEDDVKVAGMVVMDIAPATYSVTDGTERLE
jgi:hypothetical protein